MEDVDEKKVFVRLNEYKEAIDLFEELKNKLNDAKDSISNIEKLHNEEKEEITVWENSLVEIEKKIGYVDSLILGKEDN
ncbi:MAG: hypothetical protein ACOC3X_00410 [Nanoarchaeota archaeon]